MRQRTWLGLGLGIATIMLALSPQVATCQTEQLAAEADLTAARFNLENWNQFRAFVDGNRTPGPTDRKLFTAAARYYVYYMTLKNRQRESGRLDRHRRVQFYSSTIRTGILNPGHYPKNKDARVQFSEEMIKCFKKVFALKFDENNVSIINAGLMLPMLAEIKEPIIADYCGEVIADKKNHNVIKLFAFQALAVHYEASPPKIGGFEPDDVRLRYVKQIQPVIDFVLAAPEPYTTKKWSIGEIDGYRYVRTAAIKALAETRLAWIPQMPKPGEKKPAKVHAYIAYALLKVLSEGQEGLSPPASLEEKIEAIKGLCRINAGRSLVENQPSYYNPEPAVKLIGRTLVEYAKAYIADRTVFKNAKFKNVPTQLPWKSLAFDLEKDLEKLPQHVAGSKFASFAQSIVDDAKQSIFKRSRYLDVIDPPDGLDRLVNKMPAPNPVVYRGYDSKIIVP